VKGAHRLLIGLVLVASACTASDGSEVASSPKITPVSDSSPYLCTFVPERALRLALNAGGSLVDRATGTKESGQCRVPAEHPYLLYVGWSQEQKGWTKEDIDLVLQSKKNAYARQGGVSLPSDLGDGMAAKLNGGLPGQPYEMTAKFLCGGKERFLTFSFSEFAEGRDAFRDMTDLMRIAQMRYADQYRCDLGK
jgi:hypothetical protein